MSVPQKICEIRCGAKGWDESQCGFSFYGVENGLLLRLIYHTERLKPFWDCGRTVFFLCVSSSSNQIHKVLKPFTVVDVRNRRFFRQFGGRRNFRWDWAYVETFFMLVFMSKIRVKARLTKLACAVAKATDFRWSQMLTVCNTARVQAGYVLWLQLFCSTVILSHSDLQLNA